MRTVTTVAVLLMTCVLTPVAAMAQMPPSQNPADQSRTDQDGTDQEAPSSPPTDTAAQPAAPGAATTFGTWMQQSGQRMQQGVADMGAGFGEIVGAIGGQANRTTKDAADAARSAATSVSKLPQTSVITGNERCVIAPNGAPDCRGAAATLCRAKGYVGGSSVDFVTVENCPPPYRTQRRDAPEGVCTKEHYVTKALCQ
jgi:hypothetical protein